MTFRITLIIFVFFLSAQMSFAQQILISGKVVDSNKSPIEFSNIFIQDLEKKLSPKGTTSERNGSFKLEIPQKGDYEITISFIGYADWKKTINIQKSIDLGQIVLESSTGDLEEITVTAERNMITQKEGKLIFNVATSPLKSGYDGMEVLQRSPNVLVDSEGNISIRNEAPIILINGRKTNLHGAELANFLSNIQSDNIKNIEIQTHLSANTDGESSGGVINIILKKKPVGFNGSVRSDYTHKGGGFEEVYGGLNFNYGAQKWNIYGALNAFHDASESIINNSTDYFETGDLITMGEIFESRFRRQNYQIGFVSDLAENHLLGIEGYVTNSNYRFDNYGSIKAFNNENLLENGVALTTNLSENELYNFTLNYAWTIDTSKSNLKFFADYAQQEVLRDNIAISEYEKGFYVNTSERNNSPTNTIIYSLQADLEKYLKQNFKLKTGTKLSYTDRENTLFSDVLINDEWTPTDRTTSYNYIEQVLAGYASLSKNIGTNSFLEIGMRVENTDLERLDLKDNSVIQQNYTNWFPSFYFSRDLKNNKTISFSYSRRLRRPPFQFLNNNVLKINDFRYELGNPDLVPEKVNNWEISWNEKNQSLAIYLRNTTEAINGIYYLDGQVAYYQKFNEGSQQQIGLSYNRFGNLFDWWYVKGLVSIFQRKFTNSAGVDSFKRTTTRLNLTNNFKVNETLNIDLTGSYISKYEDAYYVAYGRYRVNFMIQKSFLNKKLLARIYVNDVFNTLEYGAERPFDNFRTERIQRWRSRNIRFWLTYNFNGKNKVNKRKNKSKNDVRGRL